MLYRKTGFPEDNELVLCLVTAVHYNSVFVKLEEYDKSGMIHISEISPGRIRNIRDFVVEGKKIVCKVLKIDREKGHIDLSLRRVNENQRKNKVNELKQEQKAEKILEFITKKFNMDLKETYTKVMDTITDKYEMLHSFFNEVVMENADIKEIEMPELEKELLELINQRIAKPEVEIKGSFKLKTYDGNGVEIIRNALKKAEDVGKAGIELKYKGAGTFSLKIKSEDYKTAEKLLKKVTGATLNFMEGKGSAEFVRAEK